ncbi:MAG: hypothetical protein Q8M58_04465, partial [Anaerolineales bacterium]|nr:hypothetical protein [Anaerolineales bacterium]
GFGQFLDEGVHRLFQGVNSRKVRQRMRKRIKQTTNRGTNKRIKQTANRGTNKRMTMEDRGASAGAGGQLFSWAERCVSIPDGVCQN